MGKSLREFNDWQEGTLQLPKIETDREIIKLHKEMEARTGIKSGSISFHIYGAIHRSIMKAVSQTDEAIKRMISGEMK